MKSIFALFSLLWISNAYAYLDPGTGSLFLQSAIAGIAGGLFVIKTYWQKIKSKLFPSKNEEEEKNADDQL